MLALKISMHGRQPLDDNPYVRRGDSYVEINALAELRFGSVAIYANALNLTDVRQQDSQSSTPPFAGTRRRSDYGCGGAWGWADLQRGTATETLEASPRLLRMPHPILMRMPAHQCHAQTGRAEVLMKTSRVVGIRVHVFLRTDRAGGTKRVS